MCIIIFATEVVDITKHKKKRKSVEAYSNY